MINDDEDQTDDVVRNLAFGVSAGTQDLDSYTHWVKSN